MAMENIIRRMFLKMPVRVVTRPEVFATYSCALVKRHLVSFEYQEIIERQLTNTRLTKFKKNASSALRHNMIHPTCLTSSHETLGISTVPAISKFNTAQTGA